MNKVLEDDLVVRRQRLQNYLQKNNLDACVVTSPVNVFYLAGKVYNGYCYVASEGETLHFVKRPENAGLENEIDAYKPELILEKLDELQLAHPKSLLLETDVISYNHIIRLMKAFKVDVIQDASSVLRRLRSVKTDFELKQMQACARQHELVYSKIPELFKRGMTDVELQIEIERVMRLNGSMGIFRSYGENMDIFMGSLLVGDNAEVASPFDYSLGGQGESPIIPIGARGDVIKEGQTIMVDMAGNYSPWVTDMTRVFSVGKVPELAHRAHQASIDIQDKIMEIAKPGVVCSDLYKIAYDIVVKYDLEYCFMGTEFQAKFIGHGLGLEINEVPIITPRSKEVLEPNIAFALEPKFVLKGIGAVGVENTLLVTENGLEKITHFEEPIIEL